MGMFFGSKLQLYALIAVGFVLGLLGIYSAGIARGQDKIKRKMDQKLIDSMRTQKEIENEINAMDDKRTTDLARKWLRSDKE